jgi:predicted N-acetyltransferase YhbS
MIAIRPETKRDAAAREALLDEAFGAARFAKTAQRLREGRLPAEQLSFVACRDGKLIGTVRLWNISAGPGRPALLLGPLAVARQYRNAGVGAALIRHALAAASERGHGAVLLVGDTPYYGLIMGASASPPTRPALCGCPALTSAIASSPANSSPAPSTARAGSSARPADRRPRPLSPRW